MTRLFDRSKAPAAQANNAVIIEKINPKTGEVLVMSNAQLLAIPDMSTVTAISDVVGKNPPMLNLRDHPEFNGMKLIVQRATFHSGMIEGRETNFVVMEGFIMPPNQTQPTEENRILISTGADNVYQRVANAHAGNMLPIWGILRYAARARFLD